MNLNQRILFILLSVSLSMPVMMAQGAYNTTQKAIPDRKQSLSFEEALELLHTGNQSLKIADKGVEIAKSEKGKLNAFWYPSVQSTGAFVHMSEKDRGKTTAVTIYRSGKRLCAQHHSG